MKRLPLVFLAALLAALLAGLAWYLLAGADRHDDVADAAGDPLPHADGGARTALTPDSAGAPAKRKAAAGSRIAIPEARRDVTGRCVDAATRAPLAGCAITVFDDGNLGALTHEDSNATKWHCTTGADGRFACDVDDPNEAGVTVGVELEGRLMTWLPGIRVRERGPTDIGDLNLVWGCTIRGLVVDTQGVPVSGFGVLLSGETWQRSQSGGDGSFSFAEAIPAGTWRLQGIRNARRIVDGGALRTAAGVRTQFHRIVVQALDPGKTISGIVVDAAGAPVRGYGLACRDKRRNYIANGVSGRDGTFLLFSSTAKRGERVDLLTNNRQRHKLVGGNLREVAWGTSGLRLELQRRVVGRSDIHLTVIDGDTRQPVENFRYRFYAGVPSTYNEADPPRYRIGRDVYGRGRHAHGKVMIEGSLSGAHLLSVYPADHELAPSGIEVIEVPAGSDVERTVTLFHRRAVDVEVRTRAGEPVAGTRVQLILYEGRGAFRCAANAWPVADVYDQLARTQGLVYAEGMTDAQGDVTLTGRPAATPYLLRLLGPGHIPMVHPDVRLGKEPVAVRVTVARGGTLRGRFHPLSAWRSYWPTKAGLKALANGTERARARPALILVDLDKKKFWPLGGARAITFGPDTGSFTAVGVPPGRYQVRVTCNRRGLVSAKNYGDGVVFAGAEVKRAEFELEPVASATLSGTIYVNDAPLRDSILYLRRPAPHWTQGYLDAAVNNVAATEMIRTDAAGKFTRRTVHPGTYTIATAQGQISADSVRIADGEEREKTFHIRKVTLRIMAKTSSGAAAAGRRYAVGSKTRSGSFRFGRTPGTTDDDGALTLDAAPQYEFYLFFYAGSESRRPDQRVGPLRAPIDRYADVLEVRLPSPTKKTQNKAAGK